MKTTTTLIMTGLGAIAASAIIRRRRKLADVHADVRHPSLYLPMSVRNDTALRFGRRLMSAPTPVATGVSARRETFDGAGAGSPVEALVFDGHDRVGPSGALLWIHGGGLVMGSAAQSGQLCSSIAAQLGVVVISVDYRLAPEHPFPAGLDDCYTALRGVHDRADEIGVDPNRIAVGGDSAGGGLAACLSQMALDRGGPSICFQALKYPMLDDRTAMRTDRTAREAILWTNNSNRFAWTAYLGHRPIDDDGRRYICAARRDDLAGLPPAWIGVGGIDLFHAEDVTYARRLEAAGVPCELRVEPGMYHGADVIAPDAPAMRDFRAAMLGALRDGLTERVGAPSAIETP